MSKTRAQDVLALKEQVEKAQKLRADAEVARQVASQQLNVVDEECRALGVEPDQLETEIEALDAQIDVMVAQQSSAVAAEIVAYTSIIEKARAAGVIK